MLFDDDPTEDYSIEAETFVPVEEINQLFSVPLTDLCIEREYYDDQ